MLCLALSGCSWAFMESVQYPYDPRVSEPRCTATDGWVMVDKLNTAGFTATALYATYQAAAHKGEPATNTLWTIAVGSAVAAVVYLMSAGDGSDYARDCLAARAARDRAMAKKR